MGHTLLKRCYPTIINWYAKSALTGRKSFIEKRLRQFTPHQPLSHIPVTQREWQADPEVVITHDDLYARAWECEYDEPKFDSDYNNLAAPSPHEITIRSEQAGDEMRNIPGITPENSPEIFPQPDGSSDGRDVDRHTQPDADMSVQRLDPMPTNPAAQNTMSAINRSHILTTTTDTDSVLQLSPEHICIFSGSPGNMLCRKPTYASKHLKGPPK